MGRERVDLRKMRRLSRASRWEYALIFALIALVVAVMLAVAEPVSVLQL